MTMRKVLKLFFTVLHLVVVVAVVVVVVVVQFNTHNSLTRLAISTKLLYKDFDVFFVNNVVLVKQQQTASGNTL